MIENFKTNRVESFQNPYFNKRNILQKNKKIKKNFKIQGVQGATSTEILSGPNVEQRRVQLDENSEEYSAGAEIVSTQTVSSKTRTVETITVRHFIFCL